MLSSRLAYSLTYCRAQTTYRRLREYRVINAATSGCQTAGNTKAIVCVLELRRNAGTRCVAAHFDVVPPGAAARRAPFTVGWPLRITLGRIAVVSRVVPVRAPFVDIVSHIIETVRIGSIQAYRLRPAHPAVRIVGERLRRRISPGIIRALRPATGRALPFGFRRQAITLARGRRKGVAMGERRSELQSRRALVCFRLLAKET